MAAEEMYVTVAGAGDNSGDSWANAMALSDFETDLEGSAEAGDIYYVKEGTYTLTSDLDWSSQDGSYTNPIIIIGVKTETTHEPPEFSDWASGDDRPLIAQGGYALTTGDYARVRN